MRNENTRCQCKCEPLNIKLGPFVRDERTKYVEHILDVLVESRYGPHRPYQLLVNLTDEPTVDNPVFYDLTPVGPLPSIEMEIFKREVLEAVERDIAVRRLTAMSAAAGAGPGSHHSPTTLARGSP